MSKLPNPKPAAPNSIAPQGPKTPSARVYPPMSGKTPVNGPTSKADLRPPGLQTAGNGAVTTKGAVSVKKTPVKDGNQGTNNRHRRAIKPVGSNDKLMALGSAKSYGSLAGSKQSVASKVYPHLTNPNR